MSSDNEKSVAMKFMDPEKYSKTQAGHYVINTAAVNQYAAVYPTLTENDKVLDFGSGTGETTLAITNGKLGNLGTPGSVMGSDLSEDMVKYCRNKYKHCHNLTFHQLDVTRGEHFAAKYAANFTLVTSFSCLHWVSDHPATATLTNKVLKQGGHFLHMILGGPNKNLAPELKIFNEMKKEEDWKDILMNAKYKTFKTIQVNNDWMTTVNDDGYGPIIAQDYRNLMENYGFEVTKSDDIPLHYKLSKEFLFPMLKSSVYDGFAASDIASNVDRENFLAEYKARVETAYKEDEDGLYDWYGDGVLIFGTKIRSI